MILENVGHFAESRTPLSGIRVTGEVDIRSCCRAGLRKETSILFSFYELFYSNSFYQAVVLDGAKDIVLLRRRERGYVDGRVEFDSEENSWIIYLYDRPDVDVSEYMEILPELLGNIGLTVTIL